MNIAITTVYQPFTNLGSFLQAYALKIFLEKNDHKVEFVKTSNHFESAIKLISNARPFRSYLLRIQKLFHSLQDLNRLSYTSYNNPNIDCYVWGSDEIWNITNEFFCRPIFFGYDIEAKPKIGYAISAGHATSSDFKKHSDLTLNVKNFDLILCRDKHTQNLLKENYGLETDTVIDPTLLVNVSELSENIRLPKQKYLLVYTYGIDNKMIEIIKQFASKYNLQIVSPCFWHIWADKTIECSALQFSTLVANAEYVFTTTFHGAIFSLTNHSKCCILPLRPKVQDLCISLKSDGRLLSKDCSFEDFEKIIMTDFPETEFENNLQILRTYSANRLLQALNRFKNEKIY